MRTELVAMSTDIQGRIVEVQRQHREELHEEGVCICGWHADSETDYPNHVASVLVESLGLTQEWTWSWPHGIARNVPGYGFSVGSREEAEAEGGEYNIVSRYVTKWVKR
jgi:hypothetical protein